MSPWSVLAASYLLGFAVAGAPAVWLAVVWCWVVDEIVRTWGNE